LRYALQRTKLVLEYKLISLAIALHKRAIESLLIERKYSGGVNTLVTNPVFITEMYVYLSMAVEYNEVDIAEVLINNGAPVNEAVLNRSQSREMKELLEGAMLLYTMPAVDFVGSLESIIFHDDSDRVKLYMEWGASKEDLRRAYESYQEIEERLRPDLVVLIHSYLD
jgi:hypothetical protein